MKKLFLLTVMALALPAAIDAIAESPPQKYTCLMHPEVVMDAPGDCPKCGMPLVPLKTERKRPTPKAEHPKPNEEKKLQHESQDMREHAMAMASSLNIAEPMSRESSGSSWVTD